MATPYHPRPGSTAPPYLLESCPTIQASVARAVAGAPVATVSPGEFVPVWARRLVACWA